MAAKVRGDYLETVTNLFPLFIGCLELHGIFNDLIHLHWKPEVFTGSFLLVGFELKLLSYQYFTNTAIYTWCYIWIANVFCLLSQRSVPLCTAYYLPYASRRHCSLLGSIFSGFWFYYSPSRILISGIFAAFKTQTTFLPLPSPVKLQKVLCRFFFFLLGIYAPRCETASTLRTKG